MGIPLACFFRRSRVFAEECNGAISIFIPGRSPSLLRIREERFEAQVRLLGTMFEGTRFAQMTDAWVKTKTCEGGTEHMGFRNMTKDKLQVLCPYRLDNSGDDDRSVSRRCKY